MSDSASRAAFLLIAALVLPAAADPAALDPSAGGASASARIDALHASLLEVMQNAEKLGYAGREAKLKDVVPGVFDVEFMARKALGRHWKDAEPEAQKRYVQTFSRFMVANYAGRFDGFSGQSFETLGEEPARLDTMVVKTVLHDPGDEDIELSYRMRRVGDAWRVIDVYLDGTVSELALRRSEFVSIVKRDDIDALIAALDEKIAKLRAGGEG
jgi:phospholipid transport system substrate-binding protein